MASDASNDEIPQTSNGCNRAEKSAERSEYRTGKVLAYRAVYGSGHRRRRRSRKCKSSEERLMMSRLSKVTLADETEG